MPEFSTDNSSVDSQPSAQPAAGPWHTSLIAHLAKADPDYAQYHSFDRWTEATGPVNYLVLTDPATADPDKVFSRLRWGGQVIALCHSPRQKKDLASRLADRGFTVDPSPAHITSPTWPAVVRWLAPRRHILLARKTSLIRPSELTERFTYSVELVPTPPGISACPPHLGSSPSDTVCPADHGHWCVLKQSPPVERLVARLQARFPKMDPGQLHRRAVKFTERIFPLFLTREAAILQVLERHLPAEYRHRVPRALKIERDAQGYVRKLWMTWLRNGGTPLSQLDFARQSADLLRVLHDQVGIMHLDLRLDNMVITPAGVGFVDFGSSVRVGENIGGNALLAGIFDELMRTSEIQRMLNHMWQNGSVTSQAIGCGRQKVDKAVDFFYLVLQMNNPLTNPDFVGLVEHDSTSLQARQIHQLSLEVLRPADPANPRYKSASDILNALKLLPRHTPNPHQPDHLTVYAGMA